MAAADASAAAPDPTDAAGRTLAVARCLGAGSRESLLWALAAFVLIFSIVGVGFAIVGDVRVSVWDFASYGPKYYLMSIGVMVPTVLLPSYIGQGVTRRDFARAAGVFIGGVGVTAAVVMAVGYQVEGLVYATLGWTQALSVPHVYTDPGQSHLVVAEFTLVFVAHIASGWLIGTGFARLRGWGVLTLVPALVPALVVDVVLQAGWVGYVVGDEPIARLPAALLVALVLVGATWWLNLLAIRRMPVSLR